MITPNGIQVRRKRGVALNPMDPNTWQEVADLQPRLKQRFALGAWYAVHVRKQGDRANWGDERRGDRRAGILEAVPPAASAGYPDWFAVPTHPNPGRLDAYGPLWIETKAQKAKLSEDQVRWCMHLANAGCEVAILRPRHFFGASDIVHQRLVEHNIYAECEWGGYMMRWRNTLVAAGMTVAQVMAL